MGNNTYYGPTDARQPLPCGCSGKDGAITYRTKDGERYYSECLTCHNQWYVEPQDDDTMKAYRQQQASITCDWLGMEQPEAGETVATW